MAKRTYYVQGMHCPACETLVERKVSELKGLKRVEVSLNQAKLTIEADSGKAIPSTHMLNRIFEKDGYSFSSGEPRQEKKLGVTQVAGVVGIFAVIVVLFFTLEGSGLISEIEVDSSSNLSAFFFFGIAAGLSSCAALVGGLLLSVQESWQTGRQTNSTGGFMPFLLFNASRIAAFGILGGLLGSLGSAFRFSPGASAVLILAIAVLMIVIGMQMLGVQAFRRIRLNFTGRWINSFSQGGHVRGVLMPIAFGAITFFVPCGFTMIAQAHALASGSFLRGASILSAFALGTLPVLLLISYSSVKFHRNPKFATSFRLLSGLLIIFFALFTIRGQIQILKVPSFENEKIASIQGSIPVQELQAPAIAAGEKSTEEVQVLEMEARGFEYFLKTASIRSGVPTRLEITNNGSVGCAQAVYAKGLYPDVILLEPGLNVVEFTAPSKGTYQISCSMWMVQPVTVVVE
jgi:sulfite exporter TauE/SafE/copper chaperone CopZ